MDSSANAAVTCETFVPDYVGNVYGQTPLLEFHKYLCPVRKFNSMDELADLMIVSHVELVKGEGGSASAVEGLGVAAAHATGEKCERCWKYSADIGTHAAHPTLCARCASVVEA